MIIAALAFVATLAFEIPFAKLEAMVIKGTYSILILALKKFFLIEK